MYSLCGGRQAAMNQSESSKICPENGVDSGNKITLSLQKRLEGTHV